MKRWFEQRKALIILLGIVWIVLALFFIPAYNRNTLEYMAQKEADGESAQDDRGAVWIVVATFQENITEVQKNYEIGGPTANTSFYLETMKSFSMIYWVIGIIALLMMKTEKEYEGAEHGSADWAHGEEYEILSKKEGFVLAKDYYLPMIPNPPTGKNGNILVIGGSRKW